MAVSFEEIQNQILLVVYDYMLTSDEEAFWFPLAAIREGLDVSISGAFANRAVNALAKSGDLERGEGDGEFDSLDVYTLTDKGIRNAESAIKLKGILLEQYSPAPSADRIIARISERELHSEISGSLEKLSDEIRKSNKASKELGDDKDYVEAELEAARVLASKDRFRLARLVSLIIPTLRYVADKFAGQAIGSLAKQLIELLMKQI